MTKPLTILLSVISLVLTAATAEAAECAPPQGFVDTAPPTIAPDGDLIAHTEESEIDRPLAAVLAFNETQKLEDTIDKTSELPSVSGTFNLTAGVFGPKGTRRVTCLTDGSTLVEEVLDRTRDGETFHFRYVVWNYTSEAARPIRYGVGDFLYSTVGDGRTHVRWTYAFELKDDEFPGYLGWLGQWLFRISFLDAQYADMMRGTLARIKTKAETDIPAPSGT